MTPSDIERRIRAGLRIVRFVNAYLPLPLSRWMLKKSVKQVDLPAGGFTLGLTSLHIEMVAFLAQKMNTRALMVDYRLAPERPFPAGLIHAGEDEVLRPAHVARLADLAVAAAGGGIAE